MITTFAFYATTAKDTPATIAAGAAAAINSLGSPITTSLNGNETIQAH
jgi:hypothetical protein